MEMSAAQPALSNSDIWLSGRETFSNCPCSHPPETEFNDNVPQKPVTSGASVGLYDWFLRLWSDTQPFHTEQPPLHFSPRFPHTSVLKTVPALSFWLAIPHPSLLILFCQDDCFSLMKAQKWQKIHGWLGGEKVSQRLWEGDKGVRRLWTIKPKQYWSLILTITEVAHKPAYLCTCLSGCKLWFYFSNKAAMLILTRYHLF